MKKKRRGSIDVMRAITIHNVFQDGYLNNVHTHGLENYGYPNIQMMVPGVLWPAAGELINTIANWLLNDFAGLKDGETLEDHSVTIHDDGYENRIHFALVRDEEDGDFIVPLSLTECACCGDKE